MSKPAPYPADTRAKGWRFELDLERVQQSDTWALAEAEARPWLLMLWCTAWQQTPCGSLPADERILCARIGITPKLWAKHRDVLLRGWWAADDGRLYHDTIAGQVVGMLTKKAAEKTRKAEYRERMDAERRGSPASVPRDNHGTDDTGTGTGTGTSTRTEEKTETQGGKPPARKRASVSLGPDVLVADGVAPQVAADWLTVRKAKAHPLTATAWEQTKTEAAKAGLAVGDAVQISVANGWAGFKAEWLNTPKSGPVLLANGRPQTKQEAIEAANRAVGAEWLAQQGVQ